MKNIQIIDGAENCTFSIFQATDTEFLALFTKPQQDILFDDEMGDTPEVLDALKNIWTRPVLKSEVQGIHGTIFYGMPERKQYFPVSRVYAEIDRMSVNKHEAALLNAHKEGV